MTEEFFKLFGEHHQNFFVIFACCAFAVTTTVMLCKLYFHLTGKITNLSGRTINLDSNVTNLSGRTINLESSVINLAGRTTNVESRLASVELKIDEFIIPQLIHINQSLATLNGSFNNLLVYLKSKDDKMDISFFISKSPIQLTELAERILIEIGGKSFIDNNLYDLMKEMDKKDIKTALDAQTFAPIVLSEVSNWPSFNHIKDYAFQNPYREKDKNGNDLSVPLDMITITNIMGIYLRNRYLEKHSNLNPSVLPGISTSK
jgi:hypothetical protein